MSTLDFDGLKRSLVERRDQILVDRGATMRQVERSADHTVADALDQAAEATDFAMAVNTAFIEGEELGAIDAALLKLEDGSYGQCADCREMINPKRLEAIPFAPLCIDCQRSFEEHGGYARSAFGESDDAVEV